MSLTILYAEDNRTVAEAVRDLLAEEGCEVEVCADGNAALNRIAAGVAYSLAQQFKLATTYWAQ